MTRTGAVRRRNGTCANSAPLRGRTVDARLDSTKPRSVILNRDFRGYVTSPRSRGATGNLLRRSRKPIRLYLEWSYTVRSRHETVSSTLGRVRHDGRRRWVEFDAESLRAFLANKGVRALLLSRPRSAGSSGGAPGACAGRSRPSSDVVCDTVRSSASASRVPPSTGTIFDSEAGVQRKCRMRR